MILSVTTTQLESTCINQCSDIPQIGICVSLHLPKYLWYVQTGDGNLGEHRVPITEAQLEHPSMKPSLKPSLITLSPTLKSTHKASNSSIVDTNYGIVIYAVNGINDINMIYNGNFTTTANYDINSALNSNGSDSDDKTYERESNENMKEENKEVRQNIHRNGDALKVNLIYSENYCRTILSIQYIMVHFGIVFAASFSDFVTLYDIV